MNWYAYLLLATVFVLSDKKKIDAKESLKKFMEHPLLKSKEYITKIWKFKT